jgi:hypothetical protein
VNGAHRSPARLTIAFGPADDAHHLAPLGMTMPGAAVAGLTVTGATVTGITRDVATDQAAAVLRPEAATVTLTWEVEPTSADWPDAAFRPHDSRWTRPAAALADAAAQIAAGAADPALALARETQARFAYGHPDTRFTDGHDEVPHLACGLTEGSCVDIHTYFVAAARAAGLQAAYVYGVFFPAEKQGTARDGHCWAVTRDAFGTRAWDIAHHIKGALGPVQPALNPRPGWRVGLCHSLGHRYRVAGRWVDAKVLGGPMRVVGGQADWIEPLDIRWQAEAAVPA